MREIPFPENLKRKLTQLNVSQGNPFLVLGHRQSNGKVTGGKFGITDGMAARLNEAAGDAKIRLAQAAMSTYDGVTLLAPGEGLWVAPGRIRDGSPLMRLLSSIDDRPNLTASDVEQMTLSFYAIGYGPDNNRVYFVREKAQHIGVDNKIIGLIKTAKLHPVKEPVLALDTAIDFVVTDIGLAVFAPVAFERYVQEPAEVEADFDNTVSSFAQSLPLSVNSMEALKSRGYKSLFMRGRLRSIMARPYFSSLTLPKIREKIESKKLDPTRFMNTTTFCFKAEDTNLFLKLLDQKVWRGDFDDELYSTNAAIPEV